ncbi:MAG: DUF2341 domain-containing protein, partial [Dehalococcoidia bacterium]
MYIKAKKTAQMRKHQRVRAVIVSVICLLAGALLVPGLLSIKGQSVSYSYEQQMDNTLIFKSDLVWRTDGKGDYLIPVLTEGTHALNTAIVAGGTIESITANWEFQGKATLEVSANNGANYTKIINGTSLAAGFVKGNQIRWRAQVEKDSSITQIVIGYTDTSGLAGNLGTPALTGFAYRKPVHVNNPSKEGLFNYQVKVVVSEDENQKSEAADIYCEGNIKSDFKDIRFTTADGQRILPHYLESVSGVHPFRKAVCWVKIPQIPVEGVSIYMYYGNSSAKDVSSAEDVFYLYDDFKADTLDPEKWYTSVQVGGSYSCGNSLLKLDAVNIMSKNYHITNAVIEYSARIESDGEIRTIIRGNKDNPAQSQIGYSSGTKDIEHAIVVGNIVKTNTASPVSAGTFYQYRIVAEGDNLIFTRYSSDDFSVKQAEIIYKDTNGIKQGYLGLSTAGTGRGDRVAYVDWIRVRALSSKEPFLEKSGDEEKVNTAQFLGTTLAENGNIIASSLREAEGDEAISMYATALVSTTCDISAVAVSLQSASTGTGKDVSIDLSLDNGLAWAQGCEIDKTYTAAKDFKLGKELKARLNIPSSVLAKPVEISEIKITYSQGPIITSANIYYSGATGANGTYKTGDTIYVEWDNSPKGDNNPDIVSVSCNLKVFEGPQTLQMLDKNNDNKWTAEYKLPDGIKNMGNAYVTAGNKCGFTVKDGHILAVNTTADTLAQEKLKDEEQEPEPESEEATDSNLRRRYRIKLGQDEAEVGDFSTRDFKPVVKLKRWGDEAYFQLNIPYDYVPQQDRKVDMKDGKIEWGSAERGSRFYRKESHELTRETMVKGKPVVHTFATSEHGGLKIDIFLKEKPATNVISIPFKSQGLRFMYQAPLTAEQRAQGIIRPEEVEDSYAVYHTSERDGEYKTGKAFHLYRPKIIDAKGKTTWAKPYIDERQGVFTITIDKAWLANAAYPIIVDPEFGYKSIGSSAMPITNIARGSVFTAYPMTPDRIGAYLENTGASSRKVKCAIYQDSGSGIVAQTYEITIPAQSQGWYEALYVERPELNEEDYALVAISETDDVLIYFDSGENIQGVSQAMDYTQ